MRTMRNKCVAYAVVAAIFAAGTIAFALLTAPRDKDVKR